MVPPSGDQLETKRPVASFRALPPAAGAMYCADVPSPRAQNVSSELSGAQRSAPTSGALKISIWCPPATSCTTSFRCGDSFETNAIRLPSGDRAGVISFPVSVSW
jgi:hypothetical protein